MTPGCDCLMCQTTAESLDDARWRSRAAVLLARFRRVHDIIRYDVGGVAHASLITPLEDTRKHLIDILDGRA